MNFSPLVAIFFLLCSSLLKAELPTHPEKLGDFVLFEDRKAVMKIKTNGKILLRPMKNGKEELHNGFDIIVRVMVREKGKTKWTTKRVNKESLRPIGDPAVNPKKPIGYKAKVTGDSEYQVQIERTRKGFLVKAWINDLGQDPAKPTAKGKAKEYEVRLIYGVRLNNVFYGISLNSDKDLIEKRTKGSTVKFINLDRKKVRFDFDEVAELKESGLEKGIQGYEIRSKELGKLRKLHVVPENPKETTLNLIDYADKQLFNGFTVGAISPINELGSVEDGGILISF